MGEWMRRSYDWSEDVRRLKGPVLLVYGDADMIRPEHAVTFFHLLGGGLLIHGESALARGGDHHSRQAVVMAGNAARLLKEYDIRVLQQGQALFHRSAYG